MNLLIIHEYFTDSKKNGANIIAFNTYYAIKENGHYCYFFSNNLKPLLEEQNINNLFPKSHIHSNTFKYRLNSLYNFRAERNLEKVIKEIKPDIVHIHSLLELSHSVINVLKKYNIPYVLTTHDAMLVCPVMGTKIQYCRQCSANIFNCIKNRCSKNNYFNSFYMALKFWINKQIIKHYEPAYIITPSYALNTYIQQTHFSKKSKYIVINNSLDKFFENTTPNYENKGYFLFVGQLLDIKGVNILLEAIKDLPRNIEFHIVGDGLQKEKYLQFLKQNRLNNVSLLGKKNRLELIEEYRNCISLITPSNWFEIFGMVNIEAFINGKPVIASDIGGIPEIVEHDVNGLLFKPGNVEQLKTCILKYWNNRDLVIKHGKAAFQKAKMKYTTENYYNEIMKVYRKILEK